VYAGATAIILLPSLIWVQVYEGVVTYLSVALRTSGVESRRTTLAWPAIDLSIPFDGPSTTAITYYLFWALPLLALAIVLMRHVRSNGQPDRSERATVVALAALAISANVFFLRSNLAARFGDGAIPGGAAGGMDGKRRAAWRVAASPYAGESAAGRPAPVADSHARTCTGNWRAMLRTPGSRRLVSRVRTQSRMVTAELSQLPAAALHQGLADGRLRASQYLAECTSPEDRVLVAAYAPEVEVFAQRGFAGGQPTGQFVVVYLRGRSEGNAGALGSAVRADRAGHDNLESDFVGDYPLLARRVAERYHEAGSIPLGDEDRFRVFVENDRPVRGTDTFFGLPCFR
jgi:hypothetical protein